MVIALFLLPVFTVVFSIGLEQCLDKLLMFDCLRISFLEVGCGGEKSFVLYTDDRVMKPFIGTKLFVENFEALYSNDETKISTYVSNKKKKNNTCAGGLLKHIRQRSRRN